MRLRWKVTKYPKPTMQEVLEYRKTHDIGLVSARTALTKPDEKVLQFLYKETGEDDQWIDVPVQVFEGEG